MIALFLSTLLSIFLFATMGISLTKILKLSASLSETLLLGLVFTNTLVAYSSLFFAINLNITCVFIALAFCGLIYSRMEFLLLIVNVRAQGYLFLCIAPLVLLAFTVSLSPPANYDTGLYHLQTIKWIEEFPVVPGLANLHSRLGYNPNIFCLSALTSLKQLFHQEIFSINFSIYTIVLFHIFKKLFQLFKAKGISNLLIFYSTLLFIFLQYGPNLSSPTPDILSFVIPVFIFMRMVDISTQSDDVGLKSFIPILILSCYVLTVKIAALPILLLFIFVVLKYRFTAMKSIWVAPLLVAIVIPWLIRNIILTGWLVFPVPVLNIFNCDWQVPLDKVVDEKIWIVGWARNPGLDFIAAGKMSFPDWVPSWWHHAGKKIFLIASIVSPLLAFIGQAIKKIKIDILTNAIIITSFAGVLFLFYVAPDLRFGQTFVIVAAMSPMLWIRFSWEIPYNSKVLFAVIALLFTCYFLRLNYANIKPVIAKATHGQFLITPPGIEEPENLNFITYPIKGGIVYRPGVGDQCFGHALPCTPYSDSTLVMRGKSLGDGFRVK